MYKQYGMQSLALFLSPHFGLPALQERTLDPGCRDHPGWGVGTSSVCLLLSLPLILTHTLFLSFSPLCCFQNALRLHLPFTGKLPSATEDLGSWRALGVYGGEQTRAAAFAVCIWPDDLPGPIFWVPPPSTDI